MGIIIMLYKYSKLLRHLSMVSLILVKYWKSICTIVEMGNARNEHRDMERRRIGLAHEALEKAHRAIIWTKNKLRLKEKKKTLQKQVWEALEQDDHEYDPSIDWATTIYAKKLRATCCMHLQLIGLKDIKKKCFKNLVCEPFRNGVMPKFCC